MYNNLQCVVFATFVYIVTSLKAIYRRILKMIWCHKQIVLHRITGISFIGLYIIWLQR